MPTTANKALPYPAATDTPDVPRDVLALASRLDTLLSRVIVPGATMDANTLTKDGTYASDSVSNAPAAGAWMIRVASVTDTILVQDAFPIWGASTATYRRQYLPGGTWTDWHQYAPTARTTGSTAVTPPAANTGVSVAVTFPVGLFTAAPKVVCNAQGNGYAVACAGAITASGFSARFYNPTGFVPSGTAVEWIATQD